MNTLNKSLTIIIPCRNEEKFIKKCVDSALKFEGLEDYDYEIFLIDGMSEDKTREIINESYSNNNRIKLIENKKIIQSAALNIGIRQAKGYWIMRLDAHADYPENYLSLLIKTSIDTNADNTGGIIITLPNNESYNAHLVQALTTHKFGVGNSGFRLGIKEGPVDTVPYGFFKKDIFHRIGFFDERLVRAQDYEFNCRILKNGGKIWLNPKVQLKYYNQPNLLKFLQKQIIKEAPYNAYMWFLAPYTFRLRHAITGIFAAGILAGLVLAFFISFIKYTYIIILALYALLAFMSSVQQALRYKNARHLVILPFSFFLFHFIHGIGIWLGIFKLLLGKSPVQKIKIPWENANFNKKN